MPTLSSTPTSSTAPPAGASAPASGSQVWNGNNGALIAKAMKKPRNSSFCTPGVDVELAQRVEGEGAWPSGCCHHVQADDRGQHEQAADQGVEEELHRGVLPARAAEAADEEVHRHEHDLEEDVEQEDVGGGEDADHRASSSSSRRSTPAPSAGSVARVVPGGEDHQRHEHPDEQQHHQRDAVDAEGEGDAEVGIQVYGLVELEAVAAGVEGDRRPGRRAAARPG